MDIRKNIRNKTSYIFTVTKIYLSVALILLKRGPFLLIDLWRYPWLFNFLKLYKLYKIMNFRKGHFKDGSVCTLNGIAILITNYIYDMLKNPDKLVLAEDIIPPEIIRAMGLTPFSPEILAIVLTIITPDAMEKYIDICENSGIPGDLCSLPKCAMGMALGNVLPKPKAIVASNLPCDAGMMSYVTIEKHMDVPIIRLDVPYNFRSDRAITYFSEELARMIHFLEEHTDGKMDWQELKNILKERNKTQETELELWDLAKTKPTPVASEMIYLSHLVTFNIFPGDKRSTEIFRKLIEFGKKNLEEGKGAIENETYRILLWNPPFAHFPMAFSWAETKHQAVLIMDSMTFNTIDYVDTATNESMIKGLADIIMQGPMSRHVRGPSENYFNDIFYIHNHFKIDMIWVADNIGCKMSAGLNEILREKCRERNIPVLVISYDLMDQRFTSSEDIKTCIDNFMETIMTGNLETGLFDTDAKHMISTER
ncbi:MAG: 2-hydroxyacyl-CoA dehydratase family protein [Proteobacteria bacterium]|nr:2-hydroxyacyl-CoA dehydratase family protein [Pseudomonadota bacterium]